MFPLPYDHWRLLVSLPATEAPPASLELFQQVFSARTGDRRTAISHATWLSNFNISRRMVNSYRQGRVFLAGDAAHIHSPVGGLGMNTGLQDAYNLGWKLALVLKEKAYPGLLDTYQEERLPVARAVLQQTYRNTFLVLAKNPVLRLVRDHVLVPLLSVEAIEASFAESRSQLDISYRASSLSRSFEAPRHTRCGAFPTECKVGEAREGWASRPQGWRPGAGWTLPARSGSESDDPVSGSARHRLVTLAL